LVCFLALLSVCGLLRLVLVGNVSSVPMAEVVPSPAFGWIPLGSKGQIDVFVGNVVNLHGWELLLFYENIPVNVTSIVEGSFLASAGSTDFEVIRLDEEFNATHGVVWVNCTLVEPLKAVDGGGLIATVFFESIDVGGSYLDLSQTKLYDLSGNLIPHSTVIGDYSIVGSTSPIRTFDISWNGETYTVATYSNSTVAKLNFTQPQQKVTFYVNGVHGTFGFCNITIPWTLLHDNATQAWAVYVDGNPVTPLTSTNQTHTFIYFTYALNSTSEVQIIGAEAVPELPAVIIPPLFITLTLLAIILRKLSRNRS